MARQLRFQKWNSDMAYVITETCTKDELCVDACPVDCIHPKKDEAGFEEAKQLYVEPDDCIDCGACVPVCTTNSIFPVDEVPAEYAPAIAANAAYYGKN
jgi:ferredoxin